MASSLDGALLNNPSTMAINTTLPDGGSVRLFASDYNGGQGFAAGLTLTVTATFSDGTSAQATALTTAAVVVSAVTPKQGTPGAAVPVTIDGGGFVSGATVSAGAGITVSNVAFVSASRLTATFAIDSAAALGPRDVAVTNPSGNGASLASGFTVVSPVTLALVYNGKLRDRVGAGDTALGGDGLSDATMTLTLSGAGGRTVTALQLSNGIGGTWDTTAPNAPWVLGVASSLDGALLNNATTMAVNTFMADGGSLALFASDYNNGQGFALGTVLTLTVTFSDGTSAQATTTVTTVGVTVTAVTPNQGTKGSTVAVTIDGSGFVNGAGVSAGAGITVTNVAFVSSTRLTASFAIDAAAANGPRDVTVTNPNGAGGTLTKGFVVNVPVAATLFYNGKLRDRVGGGDIALAADGAADATMTLTLSGLAGRAVIALQLSNGIGGAWDTISPNSSWVIGVAPSLDAALINNAGNMAINAAGGWRQPHAVRLGLRRWPGIRRRQNADGDRDVVGWLERSGLGDRAEHGSHRDGRHSEPGDDGRNGAGHDQRQRLRQRLDGERGSRDQRHQRRVRVFVSADGDVRDLRPDDARITGRHGDEPR